MDELIEELWNRELEYNLVPMDFIEFKQAIQTACKAQRNACAGAVECMVSKQAINKIKSAEIERQDYEGINR